MGHNAKEELIESGMFEDEPTWSAAAQSCDRIRLKVAIRNGWRTMLFACECPGAFLFQTGLPRSILYVAQYHHS